MLRNIQGVMALIAMFASYELIKFLFSFVSLKNAFVSNTSKCPPNRKQSVQFKFGNNSHNWKEVCRGLVSIVAT